MTTDRDLDRLLGRFFEDGPDSAPDRMLDVMTDRIGRQRQRPAWRLDRRLLDMNPFLKVGAAVAVVVLIAVIGYNLLPARQGIGVQPAPTPSPTASPTPSPSASQGRVFPSWYRPDVSGGAGILPSGSHTTKSFEPGFSFSVPDGWINTGDETDFYGLFPDTPDNQTEFARTGELADSIYMGPIAKPYLVCEALENNQGTAAEMVATASANNVLDVSNVVDVTMGSLTGKRFDVRADPDWTGPCPGGPPAVDLKDQRTRVYLLDSPDHGVIVIFVGSLHSAGHEALLAEAMPILESFEFTP